MIASFTYGKNIRAKHEQNLSYSFQQLIDTITQPDTHVINTIREIERLHQVAFNEKKLIDGSPAFKKFKELYIKDVKESLPYFIFGGFCPVGHNNESLQFNGCIQGDIDFKQVNGDLKAIEAKRLLQADPYIKLLCFSPSGFGVKFIIQTTLTDKEQYKDAEEQVRTYIYNTYGYLIDTLSASIPCFVPYDPQPYVNDEATVYEYKEVKREKRTYTHSAAGSDKEKALQAFIHNLAQQEVDWNQWYEIAYALINLFGEEKAPVYFDAISQKSSKYNREITEKTYRLALKSRKRNQNRERQAGWTTLCKFAEQAGYQLKVENVFRERFKEIKVNEWVTEILELADNGYLTANEVKVLLEAPTGGGKTTFAKELAKIWYNIDNSITIIAVPTNAIATQQGKKEKCPYFTSNTLEQAIEEIRYCGSFPFVFANYDTTPKALAFFKMAGAKVNLIIDEQHELINGYNYREKVVTDLYRISKELDRVILMSATPFIEGFDSYQHLKVTTSNTFKPVPRIIESKRAIDRATLTEIKRDSSKAIVLCNEKKRIEYLKQACEANKLRVATIYNDGELNNPTYEYLMEHEALPDDIDILLCTSKIATGINITAKEKTRMIYSEVVVIDNKPVFNMRLCKQFFARVRNTEMAEYVAIALKAKHEKKLINAASYFNMCKKLYSKQANDFTNYPDEPLTIARSEFAEKLEMFYREKDGTVSVNELALMYKVLSKEIRNGDIKQLVSEGEILENVAKEDLEALADAAASFREIKVKTGRQIFDLFTTKRQQLAGSIYKKLKDKKLKEYLCFEYNAKYWQQHTDIILTTPHLIEAAETAFKRDLRASKLKVREDDRHLLIFNKAKRVLVTNVVFGKTCNTLAVHLALEGTYTDEISKEQVKQYRNVKKALLLAFRKQKCLTPVEIMQIVNKYFTSYKTKTKTTQLAEIFFQLQKVHVAAGQTYYWERGLNLKRISKNLGISYERFCSIYKEKETSKSVHTDCPVYEPAFAEENITVDNINNDINDQSYDWVFSKNDDEPCPF